MKKSDKKQHEKAKEKFYKSMKEYFEGLKLIEPLDDEEFTTDDYNQLSSAVEKLTKTVRRIGERIICKRNEESSIYK